MSITSRRKWILVLPLALLVCFAIQAPGGNGQSVDKQLEPIQEAYRLILESYYLPESVDREELIKGAIEGMLEELPDDYNAVYSREEYADYRERQEGNYIGIGMEIEKSGDHVKVVSVFPDTPASRSGLNSGDTIISIDGEPTSKMTFQEAFEVLDGEKGTEVKVTVRRPEGEEVTITLTRTEIEITPVELILLEEVKVALVDINLFNRQTAPELRRALTKLRDSDIEGYVIDLRNNSGGWLNSALKVASQFVDSGLITKTVGPGGDREYSSRGNSNPNLPLVVLINSGTASASELVAGAIRDQGMGILVGRKSFGKGLVQTTHSVGRGLRVKISSSEYLTPSGEKLNEKGLSPDIESDDRSEDLDIAINWIEEHKGQLAPLEKEPAE
jgi:carboxyl-terminal processing protease